MGGLTVSDHLTTAGAGAAIVSPLWLPPLQVISDTASIILPILGVVWLVVQITVKVIEVRRKRA